MWFRAGRTRRACGRGVTALGVLLCLGFAFVFDVIDLGDLPLAQPRLHDLTAAPTPDVDPERMAFLHLLPANDADLTASHMSTSSFALARTHLTRKAPGHIRYTAVFGRAFPSRMTIYPPVSADPL